MLGEALPQTTVWIVSSVQRMSFIASRAFFP